MGVSDYRRAALRMAYDSQFRAAVRRDPVNALRGFEVSEEERARLASATDEEITASDPVPEPWTTPDIVPGDTNEFKI